MNNMNKVSQHNTLFTNMLSQEESKVDCFDRNVNEDRQKRKLVCVQQPG